MKNTNKKYGKYADALAPHIDSIKRKIANSKDGTIRIKIASMAKKLGMLGKHGTTICVGVKYILFYKGIIVATGTKNGECFLIMREKNNKDRLPPSMER